MCLALGNKQLLNIITYEYLFIGDVQMSEFFLLFYVLFGSEIGSLDSARGMRRQMSRKTEADCGQAPRAPGPAY